MAQWTIKEETGNRLVLGKTWWDQSDIGYLSLMALIVGYLVIFANSNLVKSALIMVALILGVHLLYKRNTSETKIQIDVDISSDLVSITNNRKGTTILSYAGIKEIELDKDKYDWIVCIKRVKGTFFQPAKEDPERKDEELVDVYMDIDRTKAKEIAVKIAWLVKKPVSIPSFYHKTVH